MRAGAGVIATVVVCSADGSSLEAICDHLVGRGLGPLPATSASDASWLCRYGRAEVLILDLDLPEGSALDLLRERAGDHDFPALAVLALLGAGEGAVVRRGDPAPAVDDLLGRPLDLDHLTHRTRALLHRRHGRLEEPVRVGELTIDPGRRKVMVGEKEVRLAKKEFTLLGVLAGDPTRVFSKEELLRDAWGLGGTRAGMRTLDSHASRLRRKLDPEGRRYVVNCWGVGYRLLDDAVPTAVEGT